MANPEDGGLKPGDGAADAAETVAAGSPDAEKVSLTRTEIYDWVQCVVSTVLVVMLVFFFVGGQIGVEGASMMQTLHTADRVLITNMFFEPKRGDIVIISTEAFDTPIVKRVIATGGETLRIDFDTREVSINGVVLDEPYINEPTAERGNFPGEVTVPEGYVFVMGDNRNRSTDSRFDSVGFVDTRRIIGKVWFIALPGADQYGQRDWSRLGSPY